MYVESLDLTALVEGGGVSRVFSYLRRWMSEGLGFYWPRFDNR